VSLRQLVYADRALPYEVLYQMGQEKSGEWRLLNVIIESVNLGEVYRDQFLASAREQNGDLDKVIENWTIVVVEVDN
jgi:phospholipid transport system substrate-binding protein